MIQYPTRSWLPVIIRMRGTVLPRIVVRTAIVGLIAGAVVYARRSFDVELVIPVVLHTMVGVALGLLLVFRTNASYDRYWEGRKLVGGMVNVSRDLARQVSCYLPETETRLRAQGYIIALYATIRRYLRGEQEWPELESHVPSAELSRLSEVRAAPLFVARLFTAWLTERSAAGELHELRLHRVDANISRMIDLWGGAERIGNTPLPFAYAHHIKVFLAMFCFTVPFALDEAAWFTIIGSTIVGFALFGIEEIGVEIEDPFGYDPNDLPLGDVGAKIETDVTETFS